MKGVELDGTDSDFTYFNYNDTLDLTQISNHTDKAVSEKVFAKLNEFENTGLIKIDGSTAKLTEKGAKLLKSESFKQSIPALSEKPVSLLGTTGKIVAVTKQALNVVTQSINPTSKLSR